MENDLSGRKKRVQFKESIHKRGYPNDWTPFDPVSTKFQRGKNN